MLAFLLSISLCFASTADQIDALLRAQQFQGTALVQCEENVILSRGYGYANLEHQILNHPNTVFRIASLSKEFTAVAILSLDISLEANVSDFFPDYPQGHTISVYNLLTHTSGIPSLTKMANFSNLKKEPTNLLQTMEYFKCLPLQFSPGTKMEYSDSGYIILGAIIEQVSKMSYESYLNKILLKPLSMNSTRLDIGQIIPNKASGYRKRKSELVTAEFIDMSLPSSAGGLLSTVEDLGKFDRYLTQLPENKREQLFKIYSHNTSYGYGYGFKIFERAVGHTGSIDGFSALHLRYSAIGKPNCTIILLSNIEGPSLDALQNDIITHLWR